MNTMVEIEVTGKEEMGFSFTIPHLPIKVGQQLTIDVDNHWKDKWAVEEKNIAIEVEKIEYYIRDSFGADRVTYSVQTLYCKLIDES
jgi:hypothetical protein